MVGVKSIVHRTGNMNHVIGGVNFGFLVLESCGRHIRGNFPIPKLLDLPSTARVSRSSRRFLVSIGVVLRLGLIIKKIMARPQEQQSRRKRERGKG
jgi:hypothetical protein